MFIYVNNFKPDQPYEIKADLHQDWVKTALASIGVEFKDFDFKVLAEKKGEFIELEGVFTGNVELECIRCLEKFSNPVNNKFRLFFYKDAGQYTGDGGEYELKADDLEFSLIKGDKIDVGEVMREQVILSLPDYPVCNASCQGIST